MINFNSLRKYSTIRCVHSSYDISIFRLVFHGLDNLYIYKTETFEALTIFHASTILKKIIIKQKKQNQNPKKKKKKRHKLLIFKSDLFLFLLNIYTLLSQTKYSLPI